MERIGSKVLVLGTLQFAVEVLLVWLSTPAVGQPANLLAIAAGAVGGLVPKAIWYSSYFAGQGLADLAAQLTRVYGICTGVFLVAFSGVMVSFLMRRPSSAGADETAQVALTPAERQRLVYIERMVLAVVVISAWYSFIGFGLQNGGTFPMETTAGNNVIASPIVGFPFLLGMFVYVISSHRYLRSN